MIEASPYDLVFSSVAEMARPLVSVITPVFNPGPGLAVASRSLCAQTVREFEWIVIDDGSTSPSVDTIRHCVEQTPLQVRVLRHRRNERQAIARNTGLSVARGPYIKFLDADDALDPLHLERLYAAAKTAGDRRIKFAPTRHVFLSSGATLENKGYHDLPLEKDAQVAKLLISPFLSHCGALFPKEALQQLGGYDASLVTDEDGDLLLRLLLNGWLFEAVPYVFYLYRHHSEAGRVSRDDTPEKIFARHKVVQKVIGFFDTRDEPIPDEIRSALCRRIDAVAVRHWRQNKSIAKGLIREARMLDPNYQLSGSLFERTVRKFAGITVSVKIMHALRLVRGTCFD